MPTFFMDIEGGDNRNGGTSFAVLASGTDGATNGANGFSSASATFTPAMVGHYIAFETSANNWNYDQIVSYVDAHNVTLTNPGYDNWGIHSGMAFNVGGRWRMMAAYDTTNASPWNVYVPVDYWLPDTRYIASPSPYSIGNGTWTDATPVVSFASNICAIIEDMDVAWTGANGASSSLSATDPKKGTNSVRISFPTSTNAANTKYAYRTLPAPLDLSAWRRLAFWFKRDVSSGTNWNSGFRLCLCSDTLGDVIVSEVTIAQPFSYETWFPLVLDPGASLPASVQSLAIYTGAVAPSPSIQILLDNLIAVKPAGDPLEFSLSSLVGKVHNRYWLPSQVFALNDKRKPTPPNRNGFRYRISTAGTTGATEPVWPMDIGQTVVDGTAVWTCDGPEDTWWPILNVLTANSVTLSRGLTGATTSGNNYTNFFTESETCDTLLRTPANMGGNPSTKKGFLLETLTGNSAASMSGGWSRVDMSVMDGESWFSGERGAVAIDFANPAIYLSSAGTVKNINVVRAYKAFNAAGARLEDVHLVGNYYGLILGTARLFGRGMNVSGNFNGHHFNTAITSETTAAGQSALLNVDQLVADNNANYGAVLSGIVCRNWWVRKNNVAGVYASRVPGNHESTLVNLVMLKGTGTNGISLDYSMERCRYFFINPSLDYAYAPSMMNDYLPKGVVLKDLNGVPGTTHLYGFASLLSETGAGRHTASGLAWKLTNLANFYVNTEAESIVQEFKVALSANVATTISIWVRRDWSNTLKPLQAYFVFLGGICPGVPRDIRQVASAATGVYEQLSVTITPTAACIGIVQLRMHGNSGQPAADAIYFDDFGVA